MVAYRRFLGAFKGLDGVACALKRLKPRPRHALILRVGMDEKVGGEPEWWRGSIELLRA